MERTQAAVPKRERSKLKVFLFRSQRQERHCWKPLSPSRLSGGAGRRARLHPALTGWGSWAFPHAPKGNPRAGHSQGSSFGPGGLAGNPLELSKCVCVCSCTLRTGRDLQTELSPSWPCHGLVWVAEASLLCLLGFLVPSLTYPQLLNYFSPVVLSLLAACSLTDRSQCEQAQTQRVHVLFHTFIHTPPTCLTLFTLSYTQLPFISTLSCYRSDFCLLPHCKTILYQKLPFHTKLFTLGLRSTGFGETGGHKNVRTRM